MPYSAFMLERTFNDSPVKIKNQPLKAGLIFY